MSLSVTHFDQLLLVEESGIYYFDTRKRVRVSLRYHGSTYTGATIESVFAQAGLRVIVYDSFVEYEPYKRIKSKPSHGFLTPCESVRPPEKPIPHVPREESVRYRHDHPTKGVKTYV